MFKRILVTLDGSTLAEAALPPALALAQMFGSDVVLLEAVAPAELALTAGQGQSHYNFERLLEQQKVEAAKLYLRRVCGDWRGSGVRVRLEVAVGAPPSTIVAFAAQLGAELIVMSTHGRAGLGRLLYGSVAEAVLRAAAVPVLLVPVHQPPLVVDVSDGA